MRGLLFFSGGTGPKLLSRLLAEFSLPSTHIISTFDSGRSSRELRRIFAIPAIGDIRNRLLALADIRHVSASVLQFLHFRLPGSADPQYLRHILKKLGDPAHPVWRDFSGRKKEILQKNFSCFLAAMPSKFNPQNASLGNLVLAGAYINCGKKFGPAIEVFSELVEARGAVLPVCEENLNLVAQLEDGSQVIGQHKFSRLPGRIRNVHLSVHEPDLERPADEIPCRPPLYPDAIRQVRNASLICFPMGSFYSSILPNTLVKGVGANAARNPAPKVFIPNSGQDPENSSLDIADQAARLMDNLKRDAPCAANCDLLNYALIDPQNGRYPDGVDKKMLQKLAKIDVQPIFCPIVNPDVPNEHLAKPVLELLLRLADA